jgi:hypothetical protein
LSRPGFGPAAEPPRPNSTSAVSRRLQITDCCQRPRRAAAAAPLRQTRRPWPCNLAPRPLGRPNAGFMCTEGERAPSELRKRCRRYRHRFVAIDWKVLKPLLHTDGLQPRRCEHAARFDPCPKTTVHSFDVQLVASRMPSNANKGVPVHFVPRRIDTWCAGRVAVVTRAIAFSVRPYRSD